MKRIALVLGLLGALVATAAKADYYYRDGKGNLILIAAGSAGGKTIPFSAMIDISGNPIGTNVNPLYVAFPSAQHFICDSGCGGGGGGGGLAVTYGLAIGPLGTPGGFKDASNNFQPLLGDTTNGQWVLIKNPSIPVTGSVTIGGSLPAYAATPTFNLGTLNGAALASNQVAVQGSSTGGTAAANSALIGGIYNAAPITLNNGQQAGAQLDANGYLKVNVVVGGGTGGTSSTFNSAFPVLGTPVGMSQGGNFVAFTGTSGNLNVQCANCTGSGASATDLATFTAGTSVFAPNGGVFNDGLTAVTSGQQAMARITAQRASHVNLRNVSGAEIGTASIPLQVSLANTAANATAIKVDGSAVTQPISGTVTVQQAVAGSLQATVVPSSNTVWGLSAQGSSTTSQIGPLVQGAVTTSAPSYTTAQTNPLSLTTAGALRVDNSGVIQPVSQSGTWNINNIGGTISLPTGAAVSSLQPSNIAQGAALSTQTGTLAMGSVSTSPPTYTNGQLNIMSLTAAGAVRVDATGTTQPISGAITVSSATAPISTMNSASANSGINSALSAAFDDVAPTAITENSFGMLRISSNRNLYNTIRDAAGNERGANVDASNRLATAPTLIAGSVAAGAYVSGSVLSGAFASGALVDVTNLSTPIAPTTATATKGILLGMQFNSTQATFTTGQQGAVQGTSRGALYVATGADAFHITCDSGCSAAGGSVSNATSGVATSSTNIGAVSYNYGFNGTTWDQLQVDASKNLKVLATLAAGSAAVGTVNPTTAANWGIGTSTQNSASVANGHLILGQFNTTPTTITSGNMSPFQLDNAGNLLVNIKAGASSGAVAQGSTTSGQTGGLIQAAATSSAPTYTTATTNPLSMDTAGNLRVTVAAAVGLGIGSTTSGTTGSLIMAAVQTTGATVTNGNTNPLSLDTSSNLRVNCAVGCSGGLSQGSTTSGQSGNLTLAAVVSSSPTYTNGQTNAITLDTTGALRVNLVTATGLAAASTTSGQTGSIIMGAVTTASPTYTTAQTNFLSLDTSGSLRVNCITGCGGGSGGTASNFGSAFPTAGTAIGLTNGTNMIAWSASSNYGTSPGAIAVPAVNASVTNSITIGTNAALVAGTAIIGKVGIDQTTPGTTNGVQVNAALPAGTNLMGKVGIDQTTPGTTNGTQDASTGSTGSAVPSKAAFTGAVSSGNLTGIIQADASAPINISSATTTQIVALSSGKKIYVTSLDIVAGGTGNVTIEYGTGTNCATGTTVLTGAYNLTAQAGLSKGGGLGPVLVIPASNALCILTSAGVQMSGSVAYTQF